MATNLQNQEAFDIRNFLDRLEPTKEKNKYICPVCSGYNLSIEPNTGKYQCFNGCDCRDIREAIKPWAEVMEERRQGGACVKSAKLKGGAPKAYKSASKNPVLLPQGELALARLSEVPSDIPQAVRTQITPKSVLQALLGKGVSEEELKKLTVISYDYGDNKKSHRYQCPCADSEKGYEKTFSISRTDETGKINWNKGKYAWAAYRQDEAIAAASSVDSGKVVVILSHEGEKCVEVGRAERLAGITAIGSASEEDWVCIFNKMKLNMGDCPGGAGGANRPFIHAHLCDNDDTGLKKAQTIAKAAARCQVPFVAVNLVAIYPDLCEKGDIADILVSGMTGDELAQAILEEIERIRNEEARGDEDYAKDFGGKTPPSFDPTNPESFYKPVCDQLGLPLEDCVSATAFDTWVYHREFSSAENWRVIDSAFYRWSDEHQYWQHQPDNRIATFIADAGERAFKLTHSDKFGWQLKKPYGANSFKESAFKYVRSRLERPEPLPTNTHLLGFRNCVVDLRTGQQMPHSKQYFITNIIPHDYEPNKPCPEVFRSFIVESFGEDMLEVIRAFTSMFFDPTAPYGRFPHLIGQSGGGKGTLGRFWSSLFGDEGAGSAAHFADISTPEGRHQYLTGKRIFGFPDVGGYAEGVRAFYELVDNGPMSGRALFNPVAYSKQWFMRFWLASVDHLQIENAGDGWVRRSYPIPVKSRTVKPDPDLRLKLESAKADVISWALSMPRQERDRILLSPPEAERAINLALDAALYGDSTKSFVDLCLRPSQTAGFVQHHQLHTWYVSYCREHGYTPLGMSKFISHLKTVLPRNFQDRSWSPMVNGKRERIPAHWEYLAPLPDVFVSWERESIDSGENPSPPQNLMWTCIKSQCQEGGLTDFEVSWQPKSPEPSPDGGVQGVQGTLDSKKEGGQAETTQNQGCPPCPPVQGIGKGIENWVEDAPSETLAFTNDFDCLPGGGQERTPWTPAPVLGSSLSSLSVDTLDRGGQAGQAHQDDIPAISTPTPSKEVELSFDPQANADPRMITLGSQVRVFCLGSERNEKTGIVKSLKPGTVGQIATVQLDDKSLKPSLRTIDVPVPGNDTQYLEVLKM